VGGLRIRHNVRDVDLTYQYSDFGVPGLGLRRGLGGDVVVAPYATALAAMVDPRTHWPTSPGSRRPGPGRVRLLRSRGLHPVERAGGRASRRGRAYMAHHQGMSLVSLGNVVHDGLTQRRFHAHPWSVPRSCCSRNARRARSRSPGRGPRTSMRGPLVRDLVAPTLRRFESPHDITPRTHLLSNGRYSVMVTAAGSGFSRWRDLAVTRWREDPTRTAGAASCSCGTPRPASRCGPPASSRRGRGVRRLRRRLHRGPGKIVQRDRSWRSRST
jgi:cyclic beta-1,2-glucan synthetase